MRKRQRGVTLIEFTMYSALAVAVVTTGITAILGKRSETQLQQARKQIAADIPYTISKVWFQNRGTYASLTANAAGRAVITSRGVPATTPWGDVWVISTAGNATSVSLRFPTASSPNAARYATDLAAASAGSMITSATVSGNNVIVTYRTPQ